MGITSGKETKTIEGFKKERMVYCGLMKTYVAAGFCLNGGPHQDDGACRHLVSIDKDGIVHAIPKKEAFLEVVAKE